MAAERGAGRPMWSLASTNVAATFGNQPAGSGPAGQWFGPSNPIAPQAPPEVAGRQWDYQPGFNLQVRPRAYQPISFADLRTLADSYDLLRLVIETRKDQIERMAWKIKAKEDASPSTQTIDQITKFFANPDGLYGENDFSSWLRRLLEDLFVIDAPALWCERDRAGRLIGLHPLDGATMKPVIDAWGRRPRPFMQGGKLVYPVAYQQILHGLPAVDYTAKDVIYRPRNVRPQGPYGFSPVEQVIATVNIGLKRQINQLTYYTAGNIPESLIGVPDSWVPQQIQDFQNYWDATFEGDLAARRKAKFIPGGVAKTFIQTKEPELKNIFD